MVYSKVIQGFSVSGASLNKLPPFEGPLGHVLYSEQAIILKTQSSMWWCSWLFLTESVILTRPTKAAWMLGGGSPNLSSNRRPRSLEYGCVKLRLGREEVYYEYFVCRGQSSV